MKPKYTVSICRTTVETRDYEVEAENEDQAAVMAQARAEDDVWDNYSNAELEIESISPQPMTMKLSDNRIKFAAVVDMPQAAYDYASGKEFAYTYRDGMDFSDNLFDPDGLLQECNEEIDMEERSGMDEERLAQLREAAQGLSELVALCAKEGVSYVSL